MAFNYNLIMDEAVDENSRFHLLITVTTLDLTGYDTANFVVKDSRYNGKLLADFSEGASITGQVIEVLLTAEMTKLQNWTYGDYDISVINGTDESTRVRILQGQISCNRGVINGS